MANRDTAKTWFETGDKPTQAQFATLFDWLLFIDEGIAIINVAGLTEALQGKMAKAEFDGYEQGERIEYNASGNYNLVQGSLLEKIILLPGADAEISIGTGLGTDDLMPAIPVTAAEGMVVSLDIYAKTAKTIYINGLPAGSAVVFLKRKIKQ